jgi:hypothetical protein
MADARTLPCVHAVKSCLKNARVNTHGALSGSKGAKKGSAWWLIKGHLDRYGVIINYTSAALREKKKQLNYFSQNSQLIEKQIVSLELH